MIGWHKRGAQPVAPAIARSPVAPIRLAGRVGLSLAAAALCLWLLADRLHNLDLRATATAFAHLAPGQWLAALLATTVSFWALGRYDDVMHRHLGTGRHGPASVRAGAAAIAVSQSLGFGLVTGALMRWRLLPGISLWQASRLTAAVSAGFFLAWGVITLLALALLPGPFQTAAQRALPILALLALAFLGLALLPRFGRLPLPNLILSLRLLGFAALDLGAAALALWSLFPPEAAPTLSALLPAFLLALGAGLLSGAPGGLGAFEVTLLALLPGQPEAALVAAILAFRAVYYALPALIGTLALLRPGPPPRAQPLPPPDHLARQARRAETLLLRQGEHRLARAGQAIWLIGRSRHLLVALFDPVTGPPDLQALRRLARAEGRLPVLYKTSARCAAQARRQGFRPIRIAREAVLTPHRFTLQGSARAGLRRKLRQAAAAGVTVTAADPQALPLAEMAALNAAWAARRGGERGFSMGRFAPAYLAGQQVFLAWHEGRLIGFVSFHPGAQEWGLDLMRQHDTAPDGTMQALILAALEAAARTGLPRLSLAAVPDLPAPLARWCGADAAGLTRFKLGFAPRLDPLYLAAPSLCQAALAGIGLAQAIRHPPPLPPPGAHHLPPP